MSQPSQATVEMLNAAFEATMPPAHAMGVRALEVRPGYARTTVPREGNGNHFGTMYAGVLFTVAEVLGGFIGIASFDTSRFYPLVKDVQIAFKKPARSDVFAEAQLADAELDRIAAEAAEKGKADFVLTADVTDAEGVVVATTRGTYQLRSFDK